MWGRINTNSSSNGKADTSYFKKISEIDFTNTLVNKPSRYLFIKNDKELYYIDSTNEVKILNISNQNVRSTGRTIEKGKIQQNDKYFLAGAKYLYSKSTLSLLATLTPNDSTAGSYITTVNYDGDIYMLVYSTDLTTIELFKVNSDFTNTLVMSGSSGIPTGTSKIYNTNFVVDTKDNSLRFMFTISNSNPGYYIEYDLSSGTIKSTNTFEYEGTSDNTTHYYSFCKLGKHIYYSNSYDSSSTYTNLRNGVSNFRTEGYWIKFTTNIFPYSALADNFMYTGNPDTNDVLVCMFPKDINAVFISGNILVHNSTTSSKNNIFTFYNLGGRY